MREKTPNRRSFLMTSGAVAASASASLNLMGVAHAAGSDTLKVGLVGCGGRGTGAAEQALAADKNVKLVAMADAIGITIVAAILGVPFVLAIGVLVFLGAFVPMVGARLEAFTRSYIRHVREHSV